MKLSRRIMPIVLVVTMLFTCVQPISAAVDNTNALWWEDFTGQEQNSTLDTFKYQNLNSLPWEYDVSTDTTTDLSAYDTDAKKAAYQEKVREYMLFDGVKGVYGKAPFDTSYLQQFKGDGTTMPAAYNGNKRVGHSFGTDVKDVSTSTKKIFHYSFDYATNGNYVGSEIWTSPYFYRPDKTDVQNAAYADGNAAFFKTNTQGKVFIGTGETLVNKLDAEKWYHFDYIFDTSTTTADNKTPYDVYVNGTLIGTYGYDALRGNITYTPEGATEETTISELPMAGLKSMFIQGGVNNPNGTYQVYYDNIAYNTYATKPTIAPLALTSTNSAVVVNNTAKTITLSSEITTANVISALSGTMVKSMSIKNSAGTVNSGNAANGDYLCVNTTGNTTEYYTITAPGSSSSGGSGSGSGSSSSGGDSGSGSTGTTTPTPTPEQGTNVGSWLENFNSYTGGTPSGFLLNITDTEKLTATAAAGAGGSPSFDKSFLLTAQTGATMSNFEYNFGSSSVGYKVGSDEALHLSFDYMTDGTTQPMTAWWYATSTAGGNHYAGAGNGRMLGIAKNGAISVLNQGSGKSLTPGQWTHFDYIYRACDSKFNGASSIAVYINGEEIFAPTQTTAINGQADSVFAGLRKISFRPSAPDSASGKIYIDNFGVSVVKNNPTIAQLALTSNSDSVVVNNSTKTVTLDSGIMSVTEVTSALSSTAAKSMSIKTSTGAAQTGNVSNGDYLCVSTTGNTTVYYTISAPPAPPTGGEIAGTLAITGTAKEGYTLEADISGVTPAGVGVYLSYAWKRGDTTVGTGKKYTVATADVGSEITLVATAGTPCTGTLSAKTAVITAVDSVIGIESADFDFDNTEHTLIAPTGRTAEAFYEAIKLYPMHSGSLVYKTTGQAVASSYVLSQNSGNEVVYRITAGSDSKDYTVISSLYKQSFDSFAGKSFASGGTTNHDGINFVFASGDSNSSATAVTENGNTYIKMYTASGTTQLRRDGLTAANSASKMVLGFDWWADDANNPSQLTTMYTNKSGSSWQYTDWIYFNQNGKITLINGSVEAGTWKPNKLYKVKFVMDKTTGDLRVFINGDEVYTVKTPKVSDVEFFQQLIFKNNLASGNGTCYFDNIEMYPISGVAEFDGAALKSEITSDEVIISESNVISGYGTVKVSDFGALVTAPTGSSAVMYTASGAVADANANVVKGMKYVVSAKADGYSSTYTIGDAVQITGMAIKINSVPVNILYAGSASAKADIYVQNSTKLKIKLEKKKNDSVLESKESTLAAIVGTGELTIALDDNVADEAGTSLIMSIINEAGEVLATKTVSYSETLEFGSEIMKSKGTTKGIYTMTMDDGYMLSTQNFYEPWFKKYDLRGTTVAVYNCFAENGATYTGGVTTAQNKEYFREALTRGRLEIGSHSNTHPTLTDATEAVVRSETIGSIKTLEKAFPGQQVLTFTNPGNASNDTTRAIVKEGFYAMRGGDEGSNSLDTLNLSTGSGNMYNLKIRRANGDANYKTTGGTAGLSAATMNGWLDSAVENGEWVVEMWHTIAWKLNDTDSQYYSDGGYVPISPTIGEAHMAYASELQANGDLWVASFNEATKYQQERLTSTLTDVATRTSRTITLTDTLDNDIFNYPLTIKSEVPADWTYAKVTQDSRVQTVNVVNEDGNAYIYYEATPDRGSISIEKSTTAPASGKISEIEITSTGSLEQMDITASKVSFEADVTASGTYQDYDVEWFVNGVKQYEVGTEFEYTPASEGSFGVVARARVKQADGTFATVESNIITIEVGETPPPPEYNLINENFEDRTLGATLKSSLGGFNYADDRMSDKGYSIYFRKDPTSTDDNTVISYEESMASGQGQVTVNAQVDSTKPLVISSKVYMGDTNYQGLMLAVRPNGTQTWAGSDMLALIHLKGDMDNDNTVASNVISAKDTWFNGSAFNSGYMWEANEWIRLDTYVYLNQTDMTQCTTKTVIAGGVTDTTGKDVSPVTVNVGTIDLSTAGKYLEKSNKLDIAWSVNLASWVTNNAAYLDDIKIYQQQRENQSLTLDKTSDVPTNGTTINATLVFDLDSTTVAANKINVSDGTTTLHPTSIVFDAMNPNKIGLTFANGVLSGNKQYTVSFDSSVKDLFGTSESSTATFTTAAASTPVVPPAAPQAKLSVVSQGSGNVFVGDTDELVAADKSYDLNTAFTLKAVATGEYEFAYWLDEVSGRIVSEEAEYSFTLVSDKKLAAVFTKTSADTKTVVFKNRNNQIIQKSEIDSTQSVTVPANPYYMGYEFKGWKIDGALTDVKANDTIAYADITGASATYVAYFEKGDGAYSLNLTNATATPDAADSKYAYDTKITVSANAAPESKVFSHWLKDSEIVSYDSTYSFFMGAADTSVSAVYDTTAATKEPVIMMSAPVVLTGEGRIAFFAERNLYADEGREFIETGILVDPTGTKTDFGFDTGILKATSTSSNGKGQFTVRKAGLSDGNTVRARAYMIYREGTTVKTVFSNMVEATYTAE